MPFFVFWNFFFIISKEIAHLQHRPTFVTDYTECQFRCGDGMCIHYRWVCDGYEDCTDGEDEMCENYQVSSTTTEGQWTAPPGNSL